MNRRRKIKDFEYVPKGDKAGQKKRKRPFLSGCIYVKFGIYEDSEALINL